jgi:hypothetical protein
MEIFKRYKVGNEEISVQCTEDVQNLIWNGK